MTYRLLFVFCLITLGLGAQPNLERSQKRLAKNSIAVARYTPPAADPGRKVVLLEMPFASATFLHPELLKQVSGKLIERVDLVFTTFKLSPTFDQFGLNGQRLRNLFQSNPEVFSSPLVEWNLVGQTGASSPEAGRTFFHGFVIVYRDPVGEELAHQEMNFIDSLFGEGRKTFSSDGSSSTSSDDSSVTSFDTKLRRIPDDSLRFYITPKEGHTIRDAHYTDSTYKSIRVSEYFEGYKRSWIMKTEDLIRKPSTSFLGDIVNVSFSDSVVFSVFKRNAWKDMILVCDVTGSMSPYTASVFSWMQHNWQEGRVQGVTFFNDGDAKTTGQKKLGAAGGLYDARPVAFDTIVKAARSAMDHGGGGDLPENNLEAILHAQQVFGSTGEFVMIADNYSSPRDLELMGKLNRPVHIVLCGARVVVNPDYLTLAKKTGGTVHTPTEDVVHLDQVGEGDYIQIGRYNYLYKNGKFIFVE